MGTDLVINDINDGIARGVVSESVLSETLEELRNYAYSYLYNLQKDVVNVCKAHFKYNDFTAQPDDVFTGIDLNYYRHVSVKKAFIHHNVRLKFRRSKFYNLPITNEQIDANRDIFIYNYLVFVNGYLDTSAKIRCKEDVSSVCLRAEAMGDLGSQFTTGARVDVLFLQDSKIFDVNMSRADIVKSEYKLSVGTTWKSTDKVFAFVYKGTGLKRCYNVSTDLSNHLVLPVESCNYYNDADTISIKFLFVPNHSEEFKCPAGTDYIQHKYVQMPMPSNNVLVFTKNDKNELFLDNSVSVTEKYPDIFQLPSKHTEEYEIHTLYWENYPNVDMVYDTDMKVYSKVMKVLDKYAGSTIPTLISNFKPFDYKYDIADYCSGKVSGDVSDYAPLVYKANKFNSLFKLWGFGLQLYYEKLNSDKEGYILPMSTLDLDKKLRNDNHTEIKDPDNQATFDEERYLFVFKNEDADKKLPYKFWIDGIRYIVDHAYVDGTYEYVYIPKSKISKTSTIEIERSASTAFTVKLTVGSGATPLKFPSDSDKCPFTSLFLVDSTGNYVDDTKYKITAMVNGQEKVLTHDSMMTVSNAVDMKIYPLTGDAQNSIVYAACNDVPVEFSKSVTFDNYTSRNLNTESLIHNVKPDSSRIRIFKHGLLIPSAKYNIKFPSNYNDNVKIDLVFDRYFNDFSVDYLPEGYKEVYHTDDINKNGLVNLEGYINKPFSNKYYDVFVNGVKLLPSQIETISNFTIAVKNLQTLRKLYVYEKQTAAELFKFEGQSNLLSDELLRTDTDFNKALADYIVDMKDDPTVPDVDTMSDVIDNFFIMLVEDYLESNYIDANGTIPDDIVSKYHGFFKNSVFFIDANTNYESRDNNSLVYFLSPRENPEFKHINNPYYVKEFNKLAGSFVSKYLDANSTHLALDIEFSTITRVDSDGKTYFDGNAKTNRAGTTNGMMGS